MVQGVFSIPLAGAAVAPQGPAVGRALGEFVAGPENRLLGAAVRVVLEKGAAESGGKAGSNSCHPLVLYGPSSAGKSHIALGLADWHRRHHPTAEVIVLTGTELAEQHAAALAENRLEAWRERLFAAALLVVDDVGQLAGRRGAQQELCALLDELARRDALAIVTARSLASQLGSLSTGLRSRLSGGLSVPIVLPGAAARSYIIARLSEAQGLGLSKRLVQMLSEQLVLPVPAIIGALVELSLAGEADGERLTPARIKELVTARAHGEPPTMKAIIARTARYFGLTVTQLKSPARQQGVVAARCLAMYLARRLTNTSLEKIGDALGGRDHTTVMHGCQRTEKLLKRDPATRLAATELKRQLESA